MPIDAGEPYMALEAVASCSRAPGGAEAGRSAASESDTTCSPAAAAAMAAAAALHSS